MADITVTVLADKIPEPAEKVVIILTAISTEGVADVSRGASLDPHSSLAEIHILPNGFSYGVIGWHLDSKHILTQEPLGKQAFKVHLEMSTYRNGYHFVENL